ncbi:MAG: FAD-dependent oxidoreductase [Phycisphaerales bacterium]|nr:FAD-dependent oxidoreductase [Phycisphaerales bacterium]
MPGTLRPDQSVLILGAGPTSLGAAYRLRELGHPRISIAERNAHVGGLAASFVDDAGFTWDIGGHVLFSHYEYYDRLFDTLMQGEYTLNSRESWVRMFDRWVPYPFQNNVRYLPAQQTYECISGLIAAQARRAAGEGPAQAKNFGEFIDAVFGPGIARIFMRPYNFKVWAYPPERMNKTWIGERVAVIDAERALRNVILQADDFGWGPNNQFKYPNRGTGQFYQRLAQACRTPIALNRGVTRIELARRAAHFSDGSMERFDVLVSAMPLDRLVCDVIDEVPKRIREAAGRLLHSGGHMVGVGIRRPCPSTKSWMYFPEDNCPFYRVTYLSNYSPYMTPDRHTHYSLLCETSSSPEKPVNRQTIVEDSISGLEAAGLLEPGERRDIVSTWAYHAGYSYPTPSVERDDILAEVIPWLEERGIYSRGRFGMWKYEVANTDHCVMQGVELANRLMLGEAEKTIGIVYTVTEDGRNAAEHERPGVAGSGENRLGAR